MASDHPVEIGSGPAADHQFVFEARTWPRISEWGSCPTVPQVCKVGQEPDLRGRGLILRDCMEDGFQESVIVGAAILGLHFPAFVIANGVFRLVLGCLWLDKAVHITLASGILTVNYSWALEKVAIG